MRSVNWKWRRKKCQCNITRKWRLKRWRRRCYKSSRMRNTWTRTIKCRSLSMIRLRESMSRLSPCWIKNWKKWSNRPNTKWRLWSKRLSVSRSKFRSIKSWHLNFTRSLSTMWRRLLKACRLFARISTCFGIYFMKCLVRTALPLILSESSQHSSRAISSLRKSSTKWFKRRFYSRSKLLKRS